MQAVELFIPDLQVYIAAVFVQFVDIDGALVHEITQVTLLDQVRFVEVAVQADKLLRQCRQLPPGTRYDLRLAEIEKQRDGQRQHQQARHGGIEAQVVPLLVEFIEVAALDDRIEARDHGVLEAGIVEIGIVQRIGDIGVCPVDVALFEQARGQREQRLVLLHRKAYVHRGGQDQVAFLHRAVARLPVGFGQAHRPHGIGMGLGIARTEYAFEDFERPVRLSLLHELESPFGLPVRGTDGQQRQQRIAAAADLPLIFVRQLAIVGVFYQVLVIADRVPVIAAFLVGRQPSVVDRPENVVGLQEKPRKGVEERQPQPALGEMIRVAEAAGDPDILQDIIFGRVAQEGFVVVDDLTVDPVDVLRTPGTGLAQPQLLDARLFIAGIDFAAVDRRIERPQQVARHSVTAADRGRTNQQGKEYEGKLFHSSKISRPAVPGKTARI